MSLTTRNIALLLRSKACPFHTSRISTVEALASIVRTILLPVRLHFTEDDGRDPRCPYKISFDTTQFYDSMIRQLMERSTHVDFNEKGLKLLLYFRRKKVAIHSITLVPPVLSLTREDERDCVLSIASLPGGRWWSRLKGYLQKWLAMR